MKIAKPTIRLQSVYEYLFIYLFISKTWIIQNVFWFIKIYRILVYQYTFLPLQIYAYVLLPCIETFKERIH